MNAVECLSRMSRRRHYFAWLGVCILGGCATSNTSPVSDMICQLTVEERQDCSGVPSIHKAELKLSERGTFQLMGRYDACHRVEDVNISGTYQAFPHSNGVDIELLAERSTGGDPQAKALRRTIGLINLDTETLEGRFTDTAALIRSRGQMKGAPSVPMRCSEKP